MENSRHSAIFVPVHWMPFVIFGFSHDQNHLGFSQNYYYYYFFLVFFLVFPMIKITIFSQIGLFVTCMYCSLSIKINILVSCIMHKTFAIGGICLCLCPGVWLARTQVPPMADSAVPLHGWYSDLLYSGSGISHLDLWLNHLGCNCFALNK